MVIAINDAVVVLGLMVVVFVGLPILAHFCMKFGTAGYYRAKRFMENDNKEGESNGKTET